MFNFLRIAFATPIETEEAFRLRMEQFRLDMDNLGRKQPEEVTGELMEPVYYGLRVSQALAADDKDEARHFLSELLRVSPTEVFPRLIASSAYGQLGEEAEAVAQLGIALALEPDNFAVHKHLAHHLVKRGEWQAAKAILERGWIHYRKHVAKGDQEAKRIEYFAILEYKHAA